MPDVLEKVIRAGIAAPSGDNVQPWKFAVSDDRIRVLNMPERDTSLYNFRQSASLIAHGCLLTNMRLAAAAGGYDTRIVLSDNPLTANVVADVRLSKANVGADPLSRHIAARHSNRRPYLDETITAAQKATLERAVSSEPYVLLTFVDGANKDAIARAVAVNERVVLENRDLHSFLFRHITWSAEEDEKTPGFFIDTLELQTPDRAAFRLFRNWALLSLANKVGLARAIAAKNASLYATAPCICVFSSASADARAYIAVGMALERFWLAATALGISVQPLAGIVLLAERLRSGDYATLSREHCAMIEAAATDIASASGNVHSHILFVARIGRAPAPIARTKRMEPVIVRE